MPIEISSAGGRHSTATCRDCGVPNVGAFDVCPRCLWRHDFTESDREVHARAMRRALFEFKASCTYSPSAEAS
jgi:hypothetical protein